MKFYLYEKGSRKSFGHAEGWNKKFWGSFYTVDRSFSYNEGGGGHKQFPPLKKKGGGGARKVLPSLHGGGVQNVSDSQYSHFVSHRT